MFSPWLELKAFTAIFRQYGDPIASTFEAIIAAIAIQRTYFDSGLEKYGLTKFQTSHFEAFCFLSCSRALCPFIEFYIIFSVFA